MSIFPEPLSAEIHQTLRDAGYDPDAVRPHFRTSAARTIARAGGMTYRVQCYRQGPRAVCGLSEWHTSLASALTALLDHQQRAWSSVALVPQIGQVPYQEQLGFTLGERL